MLHYPFKNLQRCMTDFKIGQRSDPASAFNVHGRRDAWYLFHGICGKHLQGASSIKRGGRSIPNPDYYGDEDGEHIVRFDKFMRTMCYEELPYLPSGVQCADFVINKKGLRLASTAAAHGRRHARTSERP